MVALAAAGSPAVKPAEDLRFALASSLVPPQPNTSGAEYTNANP